MKRSENTEMDLLLRRLARRDAARLSASFEDKGNAHVDDDGRAAGSMHMDADELSAYAENALPVAARARYSAHLADCERCRRLVTELSLAANVAGQLERAEKPAEAAPSSSWWRSLASFLTLPAVRYGVPALALLLVIGIVFFSTRESGSNADLARRTATGEKSVADAPQVVREQPPPANETGPKGFFDGPPASNSNANQPAPRQADPKSAGTGSSVGPMDEQTRQLERKAQPAAQPKPSELSAEESARPVLDGVARNDAPASKAGPDAPSTAAAAPRSQSAMREADQITQLDKEKKVEVQQQQQQNSYENRPGYAGAANKANENSELAADRAGILGKSAPMSVARRGRRSEEAARDKDAARGGGEPRASTATRRESSAETRRVAGRTFERQGEAWVDTAYSSARALTSVRRGSEQYRALVADEPELRTIAEQLSGPIIVVWKGRAYRIN